MTGVLKPLGAALTRLPFGPGNPGRTAGPAFQMYYQMGNFVPWRDAAWVLLSERAAILSRRRPHRAARRIAARHLGVTASGPGPPAIAAVASRCDVAGQCLRTRNRRIVTAPDRVLSSGSRSILSRPEEENKRVPSPSRTGRTNTMISSTSPRRRH